MAATIKLTGSRIALEGDTQSSSLPFDADTEQTCREWIQRYKAATGPNSQDILREVGRQMFEWLDTSGWASECIIGAPDRSLEIVADAIPTDKQKLLQSLPWEILVGPMGFIAADAICLFKIARRRGTRSAFATGQHRNMALLFMAASPLDLKPELDFEHEESSILDATEKLDLGLFVEESGCTDILEDRLKGVETFDAFHFSCHGTIVSHSDATTLASKGIKAGPHLLMETDEGHKTLVAPDTLALAWAGQTPNLVFLSACRSSESEGDISDTFTSELARAVPNVVGWDGSVSDSDATQFATEFYRELGGHKDTPTAAAIARLKLLQINEQSRGRASHWHLGRLWLGPNGGGPLCTRDGVTRSLNKNSGYKQMLDGKQGGPKVASQLTFVGRRRETQTACATLRQDKHAGMVILGMGNHGKSSLAARISNRFPDKKPIVVYRDYDAETVLKNILNGVAPEQRLDIQDQWIQSVKDNPENLQFALESILTGPLQNSPILLIVDDLETALLDPTPGTQLTKLTQDYSWDKSIVAIIEAFNLHRCDSRLIFTSRYDFSAFNSAGIDIAESLARLHLGPFSASELRKQWRAELEFRRRADDAALTAATDKAQADSSFNELREEVLQVADGNPGLLYILMSPLLNSEFSAVKLAIQAIREFRNNPEQLPPEENEAFEFFRRMTFSKYREALDSTENRYLKVNTLFGEALWPESPEAPVQSALDKYRSIPVPAAAMDALGSAAGITRNEEARERLVGLGLIDTYRDYSSAAKTENFLVNPFARPLVNNLNEEERATFAATAFEALEKAWANDADDWPASSRSVEALRLKLLSMIQSDVE